MPADSPQISVFATTDYRLFLKEAYAFLKSSTPYFSFRYFAKKAHLASPALLKMVMEGKRNLSLNTIDKFICGFGLKGLEADYFKRLVLYNQAKTVAQKNRHFVQLRKLMEKRKIHQLSLQEYDYFSNWFVPVIREMIPCKGFEPQPAKIADFLFNEITPNEVREALLLLRKLKLATPNKKGGLSTTKAHLQTDDSITHLALKNYHRDLIEQAKKSIDRSKPEEREIQALTLSIDPKKIPLAKKKIQDFIVEMRDILRGGEPTQVYQLSLQFYNITQGKFPS